MEAHKRREKPTKVRIKNKSAPIVTSHSETIDTDAFLFYLENPASIVEKR